MTTLTIPETESRLPDLIDRVLGGEDVITSRRGRPVATLRPVADVARPPAEPERLTAEGLAWLDAYPLAGTLPDEDAGASVSRLRDEETH